MIHNNGNLQTQTTQPLNVTQSYTYDSLNRLASMGEGSVGYDAFGNQLLTNAGSGVGRRSKLASSTD